MARRAAIADQAEDTNSSTIGWNGGRGTISVGGTFGGTTAKLQCSPDDGTTWLDIGTEVTFTEAGIANFDLAPGYILRLNTAGGSSAAVDAWIDDDKAV